MQLLDICDTECTKKGQPLAQLLPPGKLRSVVRCSLTQDMSEVPEDFHVLSLPIPTTTQRISLESCMQELQREEVLRGPNVWRSPKSEALKISARESTKHLEVHQLPSTILLHLKRFEYTNSGGARKKQVPVHCPSHLGSVPLIAIINHSGTTRGGHYTACIHQDGAWWMCDDSRVRKMSDIQMKRCCEQAYLLMYGRDGADGCQ